MSKIEIVSEVQRVLEIEAHAILKCATRLSEKLPASELHSALNYFQRTLQKGGKIVVTGVGKSGKVGQKIAATLSSTGSLAVFLHPTEGMHGDLGLLRQEDVVLALSYTGNTEEIVRLVPWIKKQGIPVIAICGYAQSKLAKACDVWIDASVEQEACPHNLAPTASTTLALAIGDALALTLMQLRGFNSDAFSINHPGGSIGNRLSLKVKDLMKSGDAVGLVSPEDTMDEVVIVATQKKWGGVLVVQGPRLLGVITDGDIRKSLSLREKFFSLRAQDVMTKQPVTALPEMMAHEALGLMENRPSQISILPVIDENGNWIGLLRLHDLVGAF